jgi:hypothetical protein
MKTNKLQVLILLFTISWISFAKSISIVDIVVNSADHDTLEAAVIAAELADDLSGGGPFTLFAPTDAAFKALPDGLLQTLLADPKGELADILLFHVVSGKAMSTDLADGQVIKTLLGKDLKVTINTNGVFINGAKVTVADIAADNGVVHVIDAVLVPPTDGPTGIVSGATTTYFNLYPNPANQFIIIESEQLSDVLGIQILDLSGKLVQQVDLDTPFENLVQLDINNLNNGIYILKSIKADQTGAQIFQVVK